MNKEPPNPIDRAADYVGGTSRLAEVLGVVSTAISNWRARGTIPNAAHCAAIEKATNGAVTRQDLRPHDWWLIWPELAEQSGSVQREVA